MHTGILCRKINFANIVNRSGTHSTFLNQRLLVFPKYRYPGIFSRRTERSYESAIHDETSSGLMHGSLPTNIRLRLRLDTRDVRLNLTYNDGADMETVVMVGRDGAVQQWTTSRTNKVRRLLVGSQMMPLPVADDAASGRDKTITLRKSTLC